MSLIQALSEKSSSPSPASRFVTWNGLLYMALGASVCAMPGLAQLLFFEPPFVGREEGLVRVMGMLLTILGWFYFIGGRTGARSFAAATVVDRVFVVPVVTVVVAMQGVFPHLHYTFAVLDPVLGLLAWRLLKK